MRVLIAPQELKGSLTARQSAAAIALGVGRALPQARLDRAPLSDGGPGFVDALCDAASGERRRVSVRDPLGRWVQAEYALIENGTTAIIEMAEASGLKRMTDAERDPLRASTHGVGDLLRAALDARVRRIIIGLGGSATTDGGAGMAEVLGVRLLDATGQPLPPGGAALTQLARIDVSQIDPRLGATEVVGATDVRNPLCGDSGASVIYGPQKGAGAADVATLDRALHRFARVVERDLQRSVRDLAGAGAAGGLGAGLSAFAGARLVDGFRAVADAVHLSERVAVADLVLTGEGRLDGQTLYGKTVAGVARLGQQHAVPVVALCGGVADGWQALLINGLTAAFSIVPGPLDEERARNHAADFLAAAAENAVRVWWAGRRVGTDVAQG